MEADRLTAPKPTYENPLGTFSARHYVHVNALAEDMREQYRAEAEDEVRKNLFELLVKDR